MRENPNFSATFTMLTAAYALNGQDEKARGTLARYLAFPESGKSIRQVRASGGPFDSDTGERIWEGLRKAGMPEE
jgi:hypothetical protein